MSLSLSRSLVVALCLAVPASAGELKTLKGETHKGDIVSVTDKAVVIDVDGKKITTPVDQVLQIDLGAAAAVPAGESFAEVMLVDGTLLKCAKVSLKKKDAILVLLQGQELTMPVTAVNWILSEADKEANQKEWKEKVLGQKWNRDVVAVRSEGVVNPIRGTLGDADEKGENIEFVLATGRKRDVPLPGPFGLYWLRGPAPGLLPVLCKVHDTSKNLIFASSVKQTDEGYTVVTATGAEIKYAKDKLAKLDYSKGKLTYLSQISPKAVKVTDNLGRGEPYRRDENLDGEEIQINGVTYKTGLALHATTELEFDLGGEYREFKAVAGIDDNVGGLDGPVVLRIIGIDEAGSETELTRLTMTRADKERTKPLALNIKDIHRLKIIVTTGDLLDLGKHLTLAEARVSK